LEVSDPNPASCDAATYTRVDTSTHWNMTTSTHFADGDPTVNIDPGLTDTNTTFVAGQLKESTDETSGIMLSGTEFTEIEYAVQATASATNGATYCFRLTDAGTATSLVTSVAPTSGPAAGGTAVTITGTDFVSGATVTFGGTAATGVTFVSSTQIDATTPAHAAGAVDVTITNPDTVSGTFIDGYTYVPPPTVTSVAPTSGPDTGGTVVTITGTNFVSGATVTFGGTAATGVTFVSSTQIDVTTPAHAAGAADVVVTNPDTQSGTLSSGYTYTTSGLIAHWTFDEGSGQTVADSSGNGHNGTLGNDTGAAADDPTWTCVAGGNALTFDGTATWVNAGDIDAIDGATKLTVVAWVKSADPTTAGRTPIRKNGSAPMWQFRQHTGGALRVSIGDQTPDGITTTTPVALNVWGHWVMSGAIGSWCSMVLGQQTMIV
jgi:hypothetical protein